jgi:hypothetical protein
VKQSIEGKKPEPESVEIIERIQKITSEIKEKHFPEAAARNIKAILGRASPWDTAKSIGERFIPPENPTQSYERLSETLEAIGLFIVPDGELESWDRSVGGHGPAWVNAVLQKDLSHAMELEGARAFVKKLASSFPTPRTS